MDGSSSALYVRNIIFGVEDSLVSTVGLLSGVAIAGVARPTVVLMGVVLIVVEAFSMAVGSLLSEHSTEEYAAQGEVPLRQSFFGGAVMFISYFVSGFIPLAPYLFVSPSSAFWLSIILSLLALFLLGALSARWFRVNVLRKGFEMFIIGGIAIAVGVIVGKLVAAM